MSDILQKIVAQKQQDVARDRSRVSESELKSQLPDMRATRGFIRSLKSDAQRYGMSLIAEVKKASPSVGLIREVFEPRVIASEYAEHGASCISVLTDETFFQGHLDDLRAVRETVEIPILRKDFVLDRYQILQARVAGADAVLLIAECLDDVQLTDLYDYAASLSLDCLIEIYEPENLERVLKLKPEILGVNNRNLRTFVTSLSHSTDLARVIPSQTLLISESGIRTREDVQILEAAGVKGLLIGETLMRSDDIGKKIHELLGR